MQVSYPYPAKIKSSVPKLSGMRFAPFTNIDGETFAKPSLNGFWRLDVTALVYQMGDSLALSSFVTQMQAAGATCVVPVLSHWYPNDASGRMLKPSFAAPEYTFDHVGWDADPFDGFTLRAAVAHRDSYIDVDKPELSQLWPGHYISLGDRLYQVTNVSAIGESSTAIRVSVMPNIRGAHALGSTVIVDHLRLECRLESGDPIGASTEVMKMSNLSFVEAF